MYDTLQGVSIQYGVPVAVLRKANNLQGDTILHLPYLLIPSSAKTECERVDEGRAEREEKALLAETLQMMFKDINKEIIKMVALQYPNFDQARAFIEGNLHIIKPIGNLMREFPVSYREAEEEFFKYYKDEKLARKSLKTQFSKLRVERGWKLKTD